MLAIKVDQQSCPKVDTAATQWKLLKSSFPKSLAACRQSSPASRGVPDQGCQQEVVAAEAGPLEPSSRQAILTPPTEVSQPGA